MPADRRIRKVRHEQASRPEKRRFAVNANAVGHLDIGSAAQISGNDILTSLSEPPSAGQLKKKDKQLIRHEALLERLGAGSTPYSKSHLKRSKRKAKEELTADLAAVSKAIEEVDAQNGSDAQLHSSDDPISRPKFRPGQIGEGKSGSLTKNQRKRTLQAEKLRHTLIMADRDFSSNPFSTIRTHAQNTLVKHQT